MAIKKSELYSSLWKSCDELRGGMDASQYKDYVLVLLFVKYVSDKYAGQKNAMIEIPKGGSFADMVALQGDKEIGDKICKILGRLAEANNLRGVIDQTDFNDPAKLGSGKEMVDRLSNLVGIFNKPELNFRGNRAEGDDLLGDAYEYLMRNFATESGKSKGQFYTPAEVSRIMATVIGIRAAKSGMQTIYDPTCGSGSLLLKGHDEAESATGKDLAISGQENDLATWALAKMNMFLHDCPSAEIWKGNTLSSPHFAEKGGLKTFDFVVANPPFSSKAWSNGVNTEHDPFGRFVFGVPPPKNGDYAFLLHVLASLKSTGKGAIIMPHGVLFRGNVEADIRKQIVRRGYIKGIIGFPPNLFYGTSIPACVIVLDKENAAARKGIFMIDASKGFLKDGNKNRLREQDIHKIVDAFNNQIEIKKFSRMVPLAEIEANDFNLNLPRYIDSTDPEDIQDIDGHLRGGIPDRDIADPWLNGNSNNGFADLLAGAAGDFNLFQGPLGSSTCMNGDCPGLIGEVPDGMPGPSSGGGGGGGGDLIHIDTHRCSGLARVLAAGNVGGPSGFNTPTFWIGVTSGSAAIITSQWAPSGSALRPYLSYITGAFGDPAGTTFSWVTDTIGSQDVANVQTVLQQGNNAGELIIELNGGQDLGNNVPVALTIPTALNCPKGTSPAP
jgi:type I restriction enzyme M protein